MNPIQRMQVNGREAEVDVSQTFAFRYDNAPNEAEKEGLVDEEIKVLDKQYIRPGSAVFLAPLTFAQIISCTDRKTLIEGLKRFGHRSLKIKVRDGKYFLSIEAGPFAHSELRQETPVEIPVDLSKLDAVARLMVGLKRRMGFHLLDE